MLPRTLEGNQISILIAFTFMLQVQLCTTCRRTFADSAQGVKPGNDIHVRQSELLACLLHHMMKLIRCALLWFAHPCPAPVLPCPCPVPALPCPNLSCNRLSYSTSPYLFQTSPSGSGLCHPALDRLSLPCPQVTHSGLPCLPLALPANALPCCAATASCVCPVKLYSQRLFSPQAITAAAVQCLKLLGAVLIVRRALEPYKPLPPNWWVSFPLPYLQSDCCTYSKLRW